MFFITKNANVITNFKSLKKGGDTPEAVTDGLNEALKLSWRNDAIKICILISDGIKILRLIYFLKNLKFYI